MSWPLCSARAKEVETKKPEVPEAVEATDPDEESRIENEADLSQSLALGDPDEKPEAEAEAKTEKPKKEKPEAKKEKPLNPNDWAQLAVRLTGESDEIRQEALVLLRKFKDLKPDLKNAFWTRRRPLALDVVATLKIKSLLPDLLKLSATDEDGFVYLTINSLIDGKNYKSVLKTYQRRLTHPLGRRVPSPAAKIAMLDTLGRMHQALDLSEVEKLLSDEDPDVRRAALRYTRGFLVRKERPDYWAVVEQAAATKPYQLRIEAYYLASELRLRFADQAKRVLRSCERDERKDLAQSCAKLARVEPLKP